MAMYFEALVIDQIRKSVLDHISSYREEIFEDRSCGILPTNFEVFGNVVKHCLECLIYLLTKEKREKQNRKNLSPPGTREI